MNIERLLIALIVLHTIFVLIQIPLIQILNIKITEFLLFLDTFIYLIELSYYSIVKEKQYD